VRPPKPAGLRALAGGGGHRPLPDVPLVETSAVPRVPRSLTGEAAAEWRRQAPRLHAAGILTSADVASLAVYCLAWQAVVDAAAEYERLGRPLTALQGDPPREVEHPVAAILRGRQSQLSRLATAMGITPASRGRVHAKAPKAATNPFAAVV